MRELSSHSSIYWTHRVLGAAAALVCAAALAVAALSAQAADYIVGPQDVLAVTLWDQPDASGKYPVEADGTISFPMIGRFKVAGMTLRQVEAELKKRLADGYFRNPQLAVAIDQYRSQRILIVGEVRTPGAYPLVGQMTIMEALAAAGSLTAEANKEAVIVRPRPEKPAGANGLGTGDAAATDDQTSAEVITIDLARFETGALARNILLKDGDTIFISRASKIVVYVTGYVRTPGAVQVGKDTTVRQALALAGGVSERGSEGRVRILRTEGGKSVEKKAELDQIVQPGDTIIVLSRIM